MEKLRDCLTHYQVKMIWNLWYGYDKDSSMTTPYDSKLESLMGYKTRNRALLQKELIELIEQGAAPAVY